MSEPTTLQPHQQRVLDELEEIKAQRAVLLERLGKLILFIESNPVFNDLSEYDQKRLRDQREAMTHIALYQGSYITILRSRSIELQAP